MQIFSGISQQMQSKRIRIDPAVYAEAAAIAYEIFDRTMFRLDFIKIQPKRILVLSALPLYAAQEVRKMYPMAEIVIVDFPSAVFAEAIDKQLPNINCVSPEQLTRGAGFDLLISHLHLAMAPLSIEVLQAMHNLLVPDGVLMAANFGVDTLCELKQAFAQVDNLQHVNSYPDMHDVGDMLMQAGFAHPVADMTHLSVQYESVYEILADLRNARLGCFAADKVRTLYGGNKLQKMRAAYPQVDGVFTVTYEVVFAHAFKVANTNRRLAPNQTAIAADSIPVRKR